MASEPISAEPIVRLAVLLSPRSANGRGMIRGIARYARQHRPDWHLFLTAEATVESLKMLGNQPVSGVIAGMHSQPQSFRRIKVPTVSITPLPPRFTYYTVCPDNAAVGMLAADYLADHGLTQLAFACGALADHASARRWEAFAKQARERKCRAIMYEDIELWSLSDYDATLQRMIAWLRQQPMPLAAVGFNDQIAAAIVDAARRAGYRVPEDVAVLGIDDDDVICNCSNPPLASIDLDPERIGYEAAAMLDLLLQRKTPPERVVKVPPKGVIERPSADVLAYDDPDVTAAIRFIRENAAGEITPDDVVGYVGVSRTGLEVKFRTYLGRSVDAEIWRVRMDRVQRLLVQTDWTLAAVAERSGFSTLAHMCRKIKLLTGKTPQEIRRERVLG